MTEFPYAADLMTLLVMAVLIAITPGLDFLMVTRNSILYSRTAGIVSAFGVGCSLWVHVGYSIAGLAAVISQSILLFSIIKYLGAAYLICLGWKALKDSKPVSIGASTALSISKPISNITAFKTGFICNLLNPKAPIFFLSIFTQLVSPGTPLWVQIVYGAIISGVHIIWFSTVAIFITQPVLTNKFTGCNAYLNKVMGAVLIGFGFKVAVASQR